MSASPFTLLGLAQELGIDAKWLRGEAKAGRIPCLPAGKRLLFNLDAVKQVLNERAATSTAAARTVSNA